MPITKHKDFCLFHQTNGCACILPFIDKPETREYLNSLIKANESLKVMKFDGETMRKIDERIAGFQNRIAELGK